MSGTKRSVRSVWYVSYLIVLLIPSVAALLIYHFASDALHQQIRETNRAFLQLLEENMESSIEYTDRMANMLVISPEFSAVRNFGAELSAGQRYQLYRFVNNNLRTGLSDQFIHQQFICLRNSRMVLTRAVYQEAEKAKSVILEDWALSDEAYWDLLNNPQERRYLPAAVGAMPVVLYAQSLPYGSPQPDVTLVVAFSSSAVLSVLDAAAWSGDGLVCVLDRNQAVILSSGNPDLDAAALGEKASRLGENEITLGGRRYLYFNTGLKPSGLRYVYVAPYDVIYEKVRLVQALTLVAMLAGFIISLVVSGYLVRRQYTPVSHILQNLDPHELRGNEYERIAQAIERGKRERVDLGQRLAESRQLLGSELLDGFLTGRLPYNANTFRLLTTHGMAMDKPLHCVVCLRAEAQGSRWGEEELQDMASELFHIRLTEQLPGLSAYQGWRRTPVIWVLGLTQDQAPGLAQTIQSCQDSVAHALDAQVDMSLSACTADVALLPDRYRQADTALEYAQMHADGKLVVYPEQPGNVASYYYQVEDELTLIQAVREGREDRVHAVLDTVAERYAKAPNVSMIQCLRFDLIATCYRAFSYADSVLARERWYDEAAVARLNRSAGLRELDRCVRDILSSLCRAVQTQRETRSEDLSDRICDFVRERWQEAELSVAVVADHFAMHASYVSRMFKEEKGMGLLEYINRYRIEQSIAPLLKGLPMAQVAAQCGFASDASFIRVFKQYMGMTPGKYREMRAGRS